METPKSRRYNVLIASLLPNIVGVLQSFHDISFEKIIQVDCGRKVVDQLFKMPFQLLIADYELPDIDIWRLSVMVRSGRFCNNRLPIVLLYEDDDIQVPSILSADYGFISISVNEIKHLHEIIPSALTYSLKPTVLVIEDDYGAAEIAESALCKEYDVDIERCGEQGFESWFAKRHDIVLLDLKLGDISGEVVLQDILREDPNQAVIIVTAYHGLDNHQNLLINGASEFISKPYRLNELRRACRMVFMKSKLMGEVQAQGSRLNQVSSRLRVADRLLKSGHIRNASCYLDSAIDVNPNNDLSDDEWTNLLSH